MLSALANVARGLSSDGKTGPAARTPAPADSFPQQWEWVAGRERQALVMVARQSGKSTGATRRAAMVALSRPKRTVLYVTLTRANARQLFFDPLKDYLDELRQPWSANEVDLRIELENGSRIYCRSADSLPSVRKARGPNWDDVLIDECNDFPDATLAQLVTNVLGPTLFRREGCISLLFTPPTIQRGWLWEQFNSGRWRLYNWKQSDNPFLPAGEAEAWLKRAGLTIDHPIARRELLGLWEPDVSAQVFALDMVRNAYDALPADFPKDRWRYALGGDIGWEHHDALVVVAWNMADPQKRLWEVFTWSDNHRDIDQLYTQFESVWRAHRPMETVTMDQAGAGGQKVLHTIENRFRELGFPLEIDYKPTNVPASVGVVNDNARTGRLMLRRTSPLWQDVPHTVWKADSNRQEIDKGKFDSHILDALRYAVWGASNYLARPARPEMTDDEKRRLRRQVAARRETSRRW